MTFSNVVAVTVTYGNRHELLKKMIARTSAEGVGGIVVVDNGANWDVTELKVDFPGLNLNIVFMGSNKGSAAGFSAGISAAIQDGAEMVWLLDDDNRPLPGALSVLQDAYESLVAEKGSRQNTAVLAFRPEHQSDVAKGIENKRINPRRSSFLGFHVLDIPHKFFIRTPWRRIQSNVALPETLRLDIAPYSGLLLHRLAVETMGLPRADFVLYADDSEWTYRITRRGGRILLVTAAKIEDMESSWNVKSRHKSSAMGLLMGDGDFRAYYGTRNATYLFTHSFQSNKAILKLNKFIYLSILSILAVKTGKYSRFRLLIKAVGDGQKGLLGLNEKYAL